MVVVVVVVVVIYRLFLGTEVLLFCYHIAFSLFSSKRVLYVYNTDCGRHYVTNVVYKLTEHMTGIIAGVALQVLYFIQM